MLIIKFSVIEAGLVDSVWNLRDYLYNIASHSKLLVVDVTFSCLQKLAHFANVPKPYVWPQPRALSDYYCVNRARWESCANEL
jgi:hypothetical protein